MPEHFLPTSDVAHLFQLHVETVYILIAKHGLPAAKIGRRWRFEKSKVHAWFDTYYQTDDVERASQRHGEA